jgi:hypothetical protein
MFTDHDLFSSPLVYPSDPLRLHPHLYPTRQFPTLIQLNPA